MPSLSFGTDFGDDDFMSAISSLSEGIWTNNNTSACEASSQAAHSTGINFGQPSPAPATLLGPQPPAVAPLTYSGNPLWITTFIPPPTVIVLPDVLLAEGSYVLCEPQQFHAGIDYTQEFLEKVFFAAWVCIRDTRTWAKHYLNQFGLEASQTYKERCTRAMEEIITVSKSCGQPVEKGGRQHQ